MPTHDYDIANQSGAAFRTDLNNVLAAIQSNNSNSSSPATTVSYQWWADTNAGVMKLRNSSNNDWIEIFQLDGTLTLEDGSVSTPALSFRDDLNTGVYSSAADTFNVATGGVERMELGAATVFNEDGADVDFRIEGDTEANLFYVDAGNDRIGINQSSPTNRLTQHEDSSGSNYHQFTNTTTGVTSSDGGLVGIDADENLLLWNLENQPIRFGVNNSEKMRLGTNGSLSINNAANGDNTLHIGITSNSSGILQKAAGNNFSVYAADSNRSASGNTITQFMGRWNGTDVAAMVLKAGSDTTNKDDGFITFQTSSANNISEKVRILSSGGITFNGDTADANAIDDYEEGSWTPSLNRSATATATNNRYTKIGRMVQLSCSLTGFSTSTDPNTLEMSGAPFASASSSSFVGSVLLSKVNEFSGYGQIAPIISSGGSTISFSVSGRGANGNFGLRYQDLNNTSDSTLTFVLTYMTA